MIISGGFIQQINHGRVFLRAFVIAKHIPAIHTQTPRRTFSTSTPGACHSAWTARRMFFFKNCDPQPVTEGADPRDPQLQRKGDAGSMRQGPPPPPQAQEVDIVNVSEDEMSYRLVEVPCVREQRGRALLWKIAFCRRVVSGGQGGGN